MALSGNAGLDQNSRPTLLALSSANDGSLVTVWANPITHRLLVDSSGGAGGTGLQFEVPTGTVNGSNVSFTVANTPKYISIDGVIKRATDSAGNTHYSYSAPTITITDGAPPTQDILSFF